MPSDLLDPLFLSKEWVLQIHQHQISRYGGGRGVRDLAALDAAVSMARQTYGGRFVHRDHFEMASAYAFHISEGQPFVDGNKRTGMASSLLFLKMNGIEVVANQYAYEALMRRVSKQQANKADVAMFLRAAFG